jgi:Rrf2 family iron-sulfur cluster assembly transcriptional regulator
MLSKASIYGIRALIYIELYGCDKFVSIGDMSEKLDISFHFLTKILQSLKEKKLISSSQGPKGGVTLARPAEKIFLIDIIRILEGEKIFNQCVLGLKGCGTETPCPIHVDWAKIAEKMKKLFYNTTVKNLADKIKKSKLRISDLKIT